MKWFLHIVLLCFLLIPNKLCAQSEDLRISAEFQDVSLDKILRKVARQYKLKFAYDGKAFRSINSSIKAENINLEEFLNTLLAESEYDYLVIDETIVFYPKTEERSASIQAKRMDFEYTSTIVDKETGERLPYANISVMETGRGTFTNSDGYFTLHHVPSDTSTLEITYVGYEKTYFQLYPNFVKNKLPIELSQNRAILPMVPIYGEQTRMLKLEDEVGSQSIDMNAVKDLPGLGENDVFRVLQLLPGVNSTNESSGNLNIRGGQNDENLVIYDGITIYHIDHFYGIFSAFNSQSIKNIRVHKTWFDSKFGGRASSVVEILGKEGNSNNFSSNVNISSTSGSVTVESPFFGNKSSILISGRRSFTDMIQSPLYKDLFNNLYNSTITASDQLETNTFDSEDTPNFHFYDISTKLTFKPSEKDLINLSLYSGKDKLNINYEEVLEDLNEKSEYNDASEWGSLGTSLRWSRKWSQSYYSNFVLSYSDYGSDLFAADIHSDLLFETVDTLFSDQKTSLKDLTIKFENEFSVDRNDISIGINFTSISIDYLLNNSEEIEVGMFEKKNNLTFYLQDEVAIGDRSKLTVGARTTYLEGTNGMYVLPRISFSRELGENLRFKMAYGKNAQAIRKTSSQNLYLNTPDVWRLSNLEEVPVLISENYLAGFTFEKASLLLDVEFYKRNLDGVIHNPTLYNTSFQSGLDFNPMIGTGEVKGVDVMLQKTIGTHKGWLGLTIARATNTFEELDEVSVPASFEQLYEFKAIYMYGFKSWNLSSAFYYGSGKPYTPIVGNYSLELVNGEVRSIAVLGEFNSGRLEPYHRLDVSIHRSFKIAGAQAELGVSLFNLYNRKNVRDIQYSTVGDPTNPETFSVQERKIFMLGTIPSFNLRIEF